jgi:hypothetical protein
MPHKPVRVGRSTLLGQADGGAEPTGSGGNISALELSNLRRRGNQHARESAAM